MPARKKTPEEIAATRRERDRRYHERLKERAAAGEQLPPTAQARVEGAGREPGNPPGGSEPAHLQRAHGRGSGGDGKILGCLFIAQPGAPPDVPRTEWIPADGSLPPMTEEAWLDERDRLRHAPPEPRPITVETPQGRYTAHIHAGSAEESIQEFKRIIRLVLEDLPGANEDAIRAAVANCPEGKKVVLA